MADLLSRDIPNNKVVLRGKVLEELEEDLEGVSSELVEDSLGKSSEDERYQIFLRHHNATEGHGGIHRTVAILRRLGYSWTKMSKDITRWIKDCPHCQKNRLSADKHTIERGHLVQFNLFEEISIDYIGPLPKDDLDNRYICNMVDGFSRFCELEAVEADTAVCAAHCLLKVVARYGCPRVIRSDRGTHFVNEVIEEFLRLFEIQSVLTLAARPQANAIAERNGGEVMRQ